MLNTISCGDCLDLIPKLQGNSINLVFTSPPYAEQRKGMYQSASDIIYPEWMASIMSALWDKMTDKGSVFIVIRSHIKDGVISDYILHTRLAIRDEGWNECEELIWHKPDAPPLGSNKRPRRTWENVLWFSKTNDPYINLKACGNNSDRIGFEGSQRFEDDSPVNKPTKSTRKGIAKISDVFTSYVGKISKKVMHPAMFPSTLPRQFIETFSVEGDTVLDPFCGAGTTLLQAYFLKRNYIGFDTSPEYSKIASDRLEIKKQLNIFS